MAYEERQEHLKTLQDMGVKVYIQGRINHNFDYYTVEETYSMQIPADFSQEQEEEAKIYWNLFLTSNKASDNTLGWPAVGSILFLVAGILEFQELVQQFHS